MRVRLVEGFPPVGDDVVPLHWSCPAGPGPVAFQRHAGFGRCIACGGLTQDRLVVRERNTVAEVPLRRRGAW